MPGLFRNRIGIPKGISFDYALDKFTPIAGVSVLSVLFYLAASPESNPILQLAGHELLKSFSPYQSAVERSDRSTLLD